MNSRRLLSRHHPRRTLSVDEAQAISIIWKTIGSTTGSKRGTDPFADDVTWIPNQKGKKLLVFKADMTVSSTDAPPQMSPSELGRKAFVAAASDFAAKGVKPVGCLVSLAVPRDKSNRSYLRALATGFRQAQQEFGVKILGGDTGESKSETVVNCSMIGFADNFVKRAGARIGDLVASSGPFGLQSAGLALLLDRQQQLRTPDRKFESSAVSSVLRPSARLRTGLELARYASSSIDSSDGLALSLYYLAEASGVDIKLIGIPKANGLDAFAELNSLNARELALFGGEEYEIVFTFPSKFEREVRDLGASVFGEAVRKSARKAAVYYRSHRIARRGYLHNE